MLPDQCWTVLRAHTRNPSGGEDLLADHLTRVAEGAARFAEPFGGGDIAGLAGRLHDAGKANPEFQEYLRRIEAGESVSHGPAHAIWGAALAYWLLRPIWKIVALPVFGHHAGLPQTARLSQRLEEFLDQSKAEIELLARNLLRKGLLGGNSTIRLPEGKTAIEMFVRVIFSALTDADFLATEKHFSGSKGDARGGCLSMPQLLARFEKTQTKLLEGAVTRGGKLNDIRREVYESCVSASCLERGVFRLTVPTGGGKTLSGLAFALRHALARKLRRILVVLPYTSIIDQTANVFRAALGREAILEHHSQVPLMDESERQNETILRLKLAAENWDAPLIVTTTVQFFESLFSNRPGKTRKLHNISRSVIVLDEVQALPVELLRPTMDVVRLLVRDYGCSVVLCTATQPSFDETPYLPELADTEIREIVPSHPQHFKDLRRVDYEIRQDPLSWGDIAGEMKALSQVMVVLNTRPDAMALLDAVGSGNGVFHLSTLLCGKHRKAVLRLVKCRLKNQRPVKLISTQVVEAGVDLDFPVVWRAMGPLDRIVQAAGRCNREGKLPGLGKVVVFRPAEGRQPRGPYKIGCDLAEAVLGRRRGDELHDPDLYREYFQRLFSYTDLDRKGIQELREDLDYPEVASRYRMIDETVPAVVSRPGSEAAFKRWQSGPSRAAWRGLQPYLVSFYQQQARGFVDDGYMEPVGKGLYRWLGRYDKVRGVMAPAWDPTDLIK